MFKGWCFSTLDVKGRSRGLVTVWNPPKLKVTNQWSLDLGLDMDITSQDIGLMFLAVKIYGPFLKRVTFWDSLLWKSLL